MGPGQRAQRWFRPRLLELPAAHAGLFGDEGALAVARAGEKIVPGIRAFCEQRGADVWLREAGMIRVSTTPSQDETMDDEVEAAASWAFRRGRPAHGRGGRAADPLPALPVGRLHARVRDDSRPRSPARCGGR